MPWKKTDDGKIIIGDSGNPIFVYPDGNEIEFDADEQVKKIRELTTKASKRKESIDSLNSNISLLSDAGVDTSSVDGIKDFLKTSKKNAETVANYKDSELVKADEVDKIKKSVEENFTRKLENQKNLFEAKLTEKDNLLAQKQKAIHKSIVRNAFHTSSFIRDKTSYPTPEIAYRDLKNKFIVEDVDGETRGFGTDRDGNKLYSLKKPTDFADLPEAIEIIVNTHPQKESLLLAEGGGTGSDDNKKRQTIGGVKTVKKGDRVAFGKNIEDIAKGKVKVEM